MLDVVEAIDSRSQEAALVRAAQAGDRAAFGALYEKYIHLVHGILLAHSSPTEAPDLVQDVFLKAIEQIRSLREPAAFGGWVVSIARRAATDHRRKHKWIAQGREETDRTAQAESEPFSVLAAIQRLPESYRETLMLRLVEGMTGPEIAVRTGLTPDSVRVNLCRGMKRLRGELKGRTRP